MRISTIKYSLFDSLKNLKRNAAISSAAATVAATLFILGTFKLAVYSRKKEISIMKYIGATDWFIRWSFVIEGITIGIWGAVISDLLLYYIYITLHS